MQDIDSLIIPADPTRRVRLRAALWLAILSPCAWNAIAQTPHWIWPAAERTANTTANFRRSFTSASPVPTAKLSGTAEFCRLSVRLNGEPVAAAEAFGSPFLLDVSRWVRVGENLLEASATSESGPAAVALRLEFVPLQAGKEIVVTDESWTCTLAATDSRQQWSKPIDLGEVYEYELDPSRQFGIAAIDDYEQWRQALPTGHSTDPSTFLVTPGFEIQLVHSATVDEGSWVSMAFDPRGRIVIGREDRGLLRMTLAADGRAVSKVESINDTLAECRGLLFAYDSLYVNANNSKGFYRLRDSDADDRFDDIQLIREFAGGVGHGRNDLTLGPDGLIYLIHGDAVDLPSDCEDLTSRFREHRRGKKSSEGHVLRTDRDGKVWQLLAAGLRNPYGIAFNPDGELFTYDADAELDMGAPWYRPTQVKHLVPGADFGWRGVTGRWPPYYPDHPDNALPNVHIGKGSPTSIQFGTRSSFPPPYRDALFILDWAYGRIIAVHLTPRGASYAGKPESFLKGRPLNVTDLDFGPDGSMYFVTGGRKTQAGLYRVRFTGPDRAIRPMTIQQQARARHASDARRLRHEMEALLASDADPSLVIKTAWPQLDDADPWIRYAARTAIERQPVAQWKDNALRENRTTAKLAALLSLARNADESDAPRILSELNSQSLDKLTPSQKVTALYTYQLCLANKGRLDQVLLSQTVRQLDAMYVDSSVEVNQLLSLLLVELNSATVLEKTIPLLVGATDQAEQMHYLFAMRKVTSGWTPAFRQTFFEALNRANQFQGGEGMPGFLKRIREDALATMSADEKQQFAGIIAAKPISEELPPERAFVRQWTMADLNDVAAEPTTDHDWENGSRMFAAVLCGRCHRVGTHGHLAGPDLTGVSRRFSRRDILQAIVDPSLVVAENYQNDRIETVDGRILVGRLIESGDYRSSAIKIATDPLRPDLAIDVAKREIASHGKVSTSPMPAGLLNTLTKDEIRDLLAFIESGGLFDNGQKNLNRR